MDAIALLAAIYGEPGLPLVDLARRDTVLALHGPDSWQDSGSLRYVASLYYFPVTSAHIIVNFSLHSRSKLRPITLFHGLPEVHGIWVRLADGLIG